MRDIKQWRAICKWQDIRKWRCISRWKSIRRWIVQCRHTWAATIWGSIQRCLVCGCPSGRRICRSCLACFKRSRYVCQTCAVPLTQHALLCGECLKASPRYDYAYSPYVYHPPLDKLINDFKHNGQLSIGTALAEPFCQMIAAYYQQYHLPLPDYVTAVPLHWRRQWQRGFNQSAVLGKAVASSLQLPYITCSKRTRYTSDQKNLSRQARLHNLKDSFRATRAFSGESIAIIDDVMTTGATVDTLAAALKAAGAGTVIVWALARTPKGEGA